MNTSRQGIGMTSLRARERMIKTLADQGIANTKVLNVMRDTPRHTLVDEALASRAYENTPLPIGHNQTISQPYIVARMTELLLQPTERPIAKVLEIGTGCGYQTAILAQLIKQVYTVERILPLQKKAQTYLWDLKLKNITFHYGDGNVGWANHAPYDGILVSAAPEEIPPALLKQLAVGGVMVIPVGPPNKQVLQRIVHTEENTFDIEELDPVVFVPFLPGKE